MPGTEVTTSTTATVKDKFQTVHKDSYEKLLGVLKTRLPISAQFYNAVKLSLTVENDFELLTYEGPVEDNSIIVGRGNMQQKETEAGVPFALLSVPTPGSLTREQAEAFVTSFADAIGQETSFLIERSSTPLIVQALLNQGHILTILACDIAVIQTENRAQTPNPSPQSENYAVRDLSPSDAQTVGQLWSWGGWDRPIHYIRKSIQRYPSAGVYSAQTKELMSWATLYNFGSIGMLFTPEENRGKGLGRLVMQHMIKGMRDRGLIPTTGFEQRNTASKGLMTSLGFEVAYSLDCIFTR